MLPYAFSAYDFLVKESLQLSHFNALFLMLSSIIWFFLLMPIEITDTNISIPCHTLSYSTFTPTHQTSISQKLQNNQNNLMAGRQNQPWLIQENFSNNHDLFKRTSNKYQISHKHIKLAYHKSYKVIKIV